MKAESKLVSLDERVGTDVSNVTSFDDLMDRAGFNFDVEKVPCHTPEGNALTGHYVVRREDSKHVLGVMRKRYTPVSNRHMFKPFHDTVQEYGATYETAGLIEGGKKCWISALLPSSFELKNRPEDQIQQRILALGCHDGTKRNAYFSIAHRISCNNQLRLILAGASSSEYSVSHTKNWETQWLDAQLGFDLAIRAHKTFEDAANDLNDRNITVGQVRGFTNLLFPDREISEQEKKNRIKSGRKPSSRIVNRREEVIDLFCSGAGNRGASRWDALNAVTEYLDHHNQAGKLEGKNGFRNAQRRFMSNVLGGAGDITKQRAFDLLLHTSKFESVKEPILN